MYERLLLGLTKAILKFLSLFYEDVRTFPVEDDPVFDRDVSDNVRMMAREDKLTRTIDLK